MTLSCMSPTKASRRWRKPHMGESLQQNVHYICQLIAAAVGIKTRTDSRISHHSCHITYTSQSDVRYFPRFYILTFDAVSLCVPKFLCDSSVTTELYQHSVNYNQFHNSYNSSLLLAIVHREQHAKWPFCHTRFFYLNSYCINLLVLSIIPAIFIIFCPIPPYLSYPFF